MLIEKDKVRLRAWATGELGNWGHYHPLKDRKSIMMNNFLFYH